MSSQQKNINNLQAKIQSLEEDFLYTDDCPYSEKIETLQDRCDALVQIIEIQAQRVCLLYCTLHSGFWVTWSLFDIKFNSRKSQYCFASFFLNN